MSAFPYDIPDAVKAGARTLSLALQMRAAFFPAMTAPIVEALASGLDVAAGLHMKLAERPSAADAAHRYGRKLFDVRQSGERFETGKGTKRSGHEALNRRHRLLGWEEVHGPGARARNAGSRLRCRLQSDRANRLVHFGSWGRHRRRGGGLHLRRRGMAFTGGRAAPLGPDRRPRLDVPPLFCGRVAGASAWRSARCVRGLPEPSRTTMRGVSFPVPSIQHVIDITMRCGSLTNPGIRPVGIAINTSSMNEDLRATS